MLRIHFTADDLARTRVAGTVGAAAETGHALDQLLCRAGPVAFRPWRRQLSRQLGGRLRDVLGPLVSLVPGPGQLLDLTALAGSGPSIEAGTEQLRSAADSLVRLEIEHLTLPRAEPRWSRALMEGDREAREVLADSLDTCYRVLVEPHWHRMRGHLDAVKAGYARTVLDGGVERLLETVCPALVRWEAPVLRVRYPRDADVRLGGRGLVLAPTVFLGGQAVLLTDLTDEAAPPVLGVPALGDPLTAAALWADGDQDGGTEARRSLGALLGRTRAAALDVVAQGCSTGELARRLNISPAAASQHAGVLRDANLIITRRRGGAVLHSITPLGVDLLNRGAAR
ncbi:winged helix-turn-helix domain-containing protein [Kitasatospora sp. NBC_00240]|uniref:winged helix-turn-helix domain-containing protein n=1 Tax=Kitasatospora sp. NBC_00240 TaxID=2903567 RepID=UPI0022544458|nr:winged helix-turn-helix domain-containing protein [Kitasatospora sp. NBC_00240]MCX5210331.1 winged helix-turn-helix domain-containing protein [Kitasatospora sp. NBC_00240]